MTFNLYRQKVKTLKEMEVLAQELKDQGKKIVTINGSFDMVHSGHIYSLEVAKEQGDILVVGLNSNKSYSLYKDKRGPLIDEIHRAIALASMQMVDYIVLFDEPNPVELLEKIKPHIHCNGASYGRECIEATIMEKLNGILYLIEELKSQELVFSTSALVEKIISRYGDDKLKAIFLERDGVVNLMKGEYNYNPADLELIPGIVESLQYLKSLGYKFFIVTDQSGIGKGKFTTGQMEEFNLALRELLIKFDLEIEHIYFCPHDESLEICECKKPCFMLFQKAKKEFNIDMARSWSIGRNLKDCQAGKLAGTKTILFDKQNTTEPNSYVDYKVDDLIKIQEIIKD